MQDASRINRYAQGIGAHRDDTWRWSRLAGVVAMCAWACASAPAQESTETIVRLYPTAIVSVDQVTLSDVAEVRGDSAELVARMELGAAPRVGQSGTLELAHVQSMLDRRGVNLSHWVFRGATRCIVQRVASNRHTAQPTNPSRRSTYPTTRPAEGKEASRAANYSIASQADGTHFIRPDMQIGSPESRPADVANGTLEELLQDYISRRLGDLGGTAVIRFSPASAKVLTLAKPTYDFRIIHRSDRLLGTVPLEVTILEAGQIKQIVPVLADVELRKSVVVTARAINRGEIVKSSSLLLEERNFDRVEDLGLSDPAPLVGQRTRRFIENHAIIGPRDIEPMPLVLANDLVTVTARRGNMSIRGSAKAQSSAGFGETVALRNEISKEVFMAVVTGPRTAEVRSMPENVTAQAPEHAVAQASEVPR